VGKHRVSVLTALTLTLPLLDVLINGIQRAFHYFAADTFYYLSVAKVFARTGLMSMDGVYTTNGFHPLWQVMTGWLYRLPLSDDAGLFLVLALSCLSIAAALWLIGVTLWPDGAPPAYLLAPIGVYALLIVPAESQYGTLWAYANGMETGALLLAYAVVLYVLMTRRRIATVHDALLLGVALSVMVLARLDHIFIAAAVGLRYGLPALRSSRRVLRYTLLAGAVLSLVLVSYLVANVVTVGTPLPVSGAAKSTFPVPHLDLPNPVQFVSNHYLRIDYDRNAQAGAVRYPQLILPLLGAALFFLSRGRGLTLDQRRTFGAAFAGVALLHMYNLLYVPIWDQGHWYTPVSVVTLTLWALLVVRLPRWPWVYAVVALVWFGLVYSDSDYNRRYADLYAVRHDVAAALGDVHLIEYDDGIVTFITGLPAMSGLGFTLDAEAAQQYRLLEVAVERDHRYLASLNYFGLPSDDMSAAEVEQRLSGTFFWRDYMAAFDYEVVLVHAGLTVVRVF